MRVIAGSARRIILKTVEGLDTRPTTDRLKETLFNMINPQLCDCNFLDLFSGSGAIGIEALSRGAAKAVFVENNRQSIECIKYNLNNTGLAENARVISGDVMSALHSMESKGMIFDIIFMDPPYNHDSERQVLEYLENTSIISSDTLIIIEADIKTDFTYIEDTKFEIVKEKKYKTNKHIFIQFAQ